MDPLILASGSQTRQRLLKGAGVAFRAQPAYVDEEAVKQAALQEGGTALTIAETLAEMKARQVALQLNDAQEPPLILGCDQTLDCDGVLFDKPANTEAVAAHLSALSGKDHSLHVSAVILHGQQRIWHVNTAVHLRMRTLSPEFIRDYVDQVGDQVTSSVGAYQLEGLGAQLFTRITGDYFTVLGLPLLEILDFLRSRGVLMT